MPHADEGRLHAYLDGALHAEDPDAARSLERHLETCADCQARLAAARAIRDEASTLLDLSLPAAAAAAPPWEEVLHRAGRDAGGSGSDGPGAVARDGAARGGPAGRIRWLPAGPPLAWAASVILALGVGWWSHAALGADPFAGSTTSPRASAPRGGRTGTARERGADAPGPEVEGEETFQAEGANPDAAVAGETARPDTPGPRSEAIGRTDAAVGAADEAAVPLQALPSGEVARLRSEAGQGREGAEREAEALRKLEAPRQADAATPNRRDRAAVVQGETLPVLADSLANALPDAPGGVAPESTDTAALADGSVAGARQPAAPGDRAANEPAADAAFERRAATFDELAEDAADADGWRPVELVEARGLLGQAPVGVPGAELLALSWGAGGRTLRVSQRLEDERRIELFEWPASAPAGAGPVFADREADSTSRKLGMLVPGFFGARSVSTVLVDGLLVAGAGAFDAAELKALLEGLAPLPGS